VKAEEDLTLTANSTPKIQAWTLGGAVSSGAGGGAGSGNTVSNLGESYITSSEGSATSPAVQANGAVTLTATDDALIQADAGGVGVALNMARAGFTTVTGSIGVAASVNTINDTTRAFISGSDVKAGGALAVHAVSTSVIDALTMGGSI